jgi:ABC-type sugar transport system ATPase subunit
MNTIHNAFPRVRLRGVSLNLKARSARAGRTKRPENPRHHVLGGIHTNDDGAIRIDGKPVEINSFRRARARREHYPSGLVLFPFDRREKHLPQPRTKARGLVDYKTIIRRAALHRRPSDSKSTRRKGFRLTIAEQQIIEIVKAISFQSRIIVMDEPTSSLSDNEIDALFEHISALKSKGIGIIYISHRLSELARIADRVTVLRDGQSVGSANVADISNDEIVP